MVSPSAVMQPIRVTMVVKLYPPWIGGLELHVAQLSETISALHSDLRISVVTAHATPARATREEVRGVSIRRATTLGRFARTPIALGMRKLVQDSRPHIIHYHSPCPWAEALAPVHGDARIVVTYYHDVVRQKYLLPIYRPVIRRLLRRADRVVAWSPELVATSPMLGEFRHKVTISAGGIDTTRFVPTPSSREHARTLRAKWAPRGPLVLFVGRLVYYKGIEYLLRAMVHVPGTLLVVGRGDEHGRLVSIACNLGLSERVHFLAEVDGTELPALYQASDVLVLPSSAPTETFGLVQVEAHVSGVPTICTDLPTGVTSVNRHELTGLVVPPADSEALAAALRRLTSDGDLRRRLGEAAQQRAVREFAISRCAGDIVGIYRAILARQDAAA
jgi:glycosyltransferase involved in cell wall biosynthesis